jgi:predicted DNA-binding transcriptional regulator AlpA
MRYDSAELRCRRPRRRELENSCWPTRGGSVHIRPRSRSCTAPPSRSWIPQRTASGRAHHACCRPTHLPEIRILRSASGCRTIRPPTDFGKRTRRASTMTMAMDEVLTAGEVSRMTGIPVSTLHDWAAKRERGIESPGPHQCKLPSRHRRWMRTDVVKWLAASRC